MLNRLYKLRVLLQAVLLFQQHPASKTIDEHLQALKSQWSRLRQLTSRFPKNMLFASIKVIKDWHFDQFLAKGADKRTSLLRTIIDDANKIMADGDEDDQQLRQLRREVDDVKCLFDKFEKRLREQVGIKFNFFFESDFIVRRPLKTDR